MPPKPVLEDESLIESFDREIRIAMCVAVVVLVNFCEVLSLRCVAESAARRQSPSTETLATNM